MENLTSTIPYTVLKRIKEDSQILEVFNLQKGYRPMMYIVLSKNERDQLYYEIIAYGSQEIRSYLNEIKDNEAMLRKTIEQMANVIDIFIRENSEENISILKVGNVIIDTRTMSEAELFCELHKVVKERD